MDEAPLNGEQPGETTREAMVRVLTKTKKGLEKKLEGYRSERLALDAKIDDVTGTIDELTTTIRRMT